MSPTIFTVIRHCEESMHQQGMKSIFYADDGVLIGANPAQLQTLFDVYTDGFERVGLPMNVAKTKTVDDPSQNRDCGRRGVCKSMGGIGSEGSHSKGRS
jgi:hypothetical protein